MGWNGPGGSSGGGGGSSNNGTDAYLQSVINGYTDQQSQYNGRLSSFEKQNPFNFDDQLAQATTAVKQRLDPYYSQTLGDFLTGINLQKSRSLEDERRVLSNLQEGIDRYTGQQTSNLQTQLYNTDQNYAQNGMYDSGARARDEGNQGVTTGQNIQNYTIPAQQQQQQEQIQTQRLVGQDLPLSEQIERRNLAQEENYNTQAQALSATQQAQNNYQFAAQQYAGNVPGSTLSYQNNLYSILGGAPKA